MKKRIGLMLVAIALITALVIPVFFAAAAQPALTTDLIETRFVTVETGVSAPWKTDEKSKSVQEGNDARKGLLLTAKGNSSRAEFTPVFAGLFELDLRVLEAAGLNAFSVDFLAEDSGETFTVNVRVVRTIEDGVAKTARQYMVAAGGERFTYNGGNEYVEVTGGASDKLRFDPNALTVHVNNELLWNFSYYSYRRANYKAGYIFDGFSEFKVTIRFTDASDGKLLLYSLNGQSLSRNVLTELYDEAAPAIYAPVKAHGVVGKEFIITEPFAYDVVDGSIPAQTVRYELYQGATVVKSGNYSAGDTYTPTVAGNYRLSYKVSDKSGREAVLDNSFEVFAEIPDVKFEIKKPVYGGTAGVGGEIEVAAARAESKLSRNGDVRVIAAIAKNGALVAGYDKTYADGFSFTFEEVGNYTVTYKVVFGGIETVQEVISYTVSSDYAALVINGNVPDIVHTGTRFAIPGGIMTFSGAAKNADISVTFPSGAVEKNNSVTVGEYGYYKLTYSAEFNGVKYISERGFTSAHTVEGLFSGKAAQLKAGAVYNRGGGSMRGLQVVETTGGGGIRFNMPIDMNGKTKDDTLIEFQAWPFKQLKADFWSFKVNLTDIHDPSNVVSFLASYPSNAANPDASNGTYVKANHSGLLYAGCEMYGTLYKEPSPFGIFFNHAFGGNPVLSSEGATIKLSMDYMQKRVYADVKNRAGMGYGSDHAICDLTEPSHFSKPWQGFTDGQCWLSIEAGNYGLGSSYARYIIAQAGGYDLSGETIKYADPSINVDMAGNTSAPDGVVGQPYKIFDAAAFNTIGEAVDCGARVYRHIDNTAFEVEIAAGYFTPAAAGNYTIEYTASDGLGYSARKALSVNVTQTVGTFTITAAASAVNTSGLTGVPIPIADIIPMNNRGVPIKWASVKNPSGNSVAIENNAFTGNTPGTYTVNFIATDYLEREATTSYTVTLQTNPIPIFDSTPALLPVYVAGAEYVLPAGFARVYGASGPVNVEASVKIVYADGTIEALGPDRKLTPSSAHGNSFEAVYTVGTREVKVSSYIVSYKMTNPISPLANFFAKDNVTATGSLLNTAFEVSNTGAAAGFVFGKPLLAESLELRFNMDFSSLLGSTFKGNFSKLRLTLFDADDPSISIILDIEKDAKTSNLRVNNASTVVPIAGSFWGRSGTNGSASDFFINYSNKDLTIMDETAKILTRIKTDASNREFSGFPSSMVYVSFEFIGVTGESGLKLSKLNNQTIGLATTDNIEPQISMLGEFGGNAVIGQTGTIPRAVAADVISEVTQGATVTVRSPSNGYVTALDGTVLNGVPASKEYQIVYEQLGEYYVTYRAVDSNGRTLTTSRKTVYILDNILPQFSLKSQMPQTGKVDNVITLPDINPASGRELTYQITVFKPDGGQIILYNSQYGAPVEIIIYNPQYGEYGNLAFNPALAGVYTVRYAVWDQYFNMSSAEYKITVS